MTAQDAGATVVVALTHAVLDSSEREAFDLHVDRVRDSMNEHPGLIGYSIGKELFGDEVWTMSAWVDEASLDAFVRSQVHKHAMRAGKPALRTLRTDRFLVPIEAIPLGWDDAFDRLESVEPRSPNAAGAARPPDHDAARSPAPGEST